jgi:DNA-binding transcriptional MerR regulator
MAEAPEAAPAARRASKSASAFRTISEVAADLDVPQHVLRFWETKFSQIRPLKRAGGRRYYRPEDVALLRRIRSLLYQDGYTIRGVQRLLREGGAKALLPDEHGVGGAAATERQVAAAPVPAMGAAEIGTTPEAALRRELQTLLDELTALRDLLRQHQK